MSTIVFLQIFLIYLAFVSCDEDWISKCGQCKCLWYDGKKTANCTGKYLSTIPTNLSDQIRYLSLSSNPIYELKAKTFAEGNLQNIQKLKMQNCSIESVHTLAFSNLGNLIELDLSKNKIKFLDENVFRENIKLRILFLNHNSIKELRGTLFHGLTHLQWVEINNNKIEEVDATVFDRGPVLQYIDLSDNRLKHLDYRLIENLDRINSLNVQGNPWVCDCHLKRFRDMASQQSLVTAPTACDTPKRLKDRLWSDLTSDDFACPPEILDPIGSKNLQMELSSNFTISCKVIGDPIPDVDWVTNGRIIDRDPRQSQQKYVTLKKHVANVIWSNLTIINVAFKDRGEYKCVAKNPGGVDEKNVTLFVHGEYRGDLSFGTTTSANALALYIGLGVGAVALLIFIVLLILCYCKRTTRQTRTKNSDMNQSSDYISLNGRPEHEKALITEVNPLVKPPRQYSVPPSVTSGVTEVCDTKKILLDDDLTQGVGDDDSRSFDYETHPIIKIPNQSLGVEYRREQLPPDLLAFPSRGAQVSPAGSNASTVADHTRLPILHGPQSPLHSPLYDTVSLYRTLPYSRSQSPFTTPLGAPVVTPRQGGYVTIPRRPRASWSSEPISSLIIDPVYDNLGLRTTASGASVLSLNKLAEASTPSKGTRPSLPSTPNYASTQCDPIAEHETIHVAQTLPRNISAHRALSPTDGTRAAWLRNGPETSSLRSVDLSDSRRDSTMSLLPKTPDGKITKIPPRPPPKPKKRASTGPLFEDEGEDGTEV